MNVLIKGRNLCDNNSYPTNMRLTRSDRSFSLDRKRLEPEEESDDVNGDLTGVFA